MNELIKIENRNGVEMVNARELHTKLGVGRDFSTWKDQRISECRFKEGIDYLYIDSPNLGNQTGRGGDRKSRDCFITTDAAKHWALMQRNDIGFKFREYFISVEDRARRLALKVSEETIEDYFCKMSQFTSRSLSRQMSIMLPGGRMVRPDMGYKSPNRVDVYELKLNYLSHDDVDECVYGRRYAEATKIWGGNRQHAYLHFVAPGINRNVLEQLKSIEGYHGVIFDYISNDEMKKRLEQDLLLTYPFAEKHIQSVIENNQLPLSDADGKPF